MDLIVTLLVIAVAAVIVFYIIGLLSLPDPIGRIVQLVLGLVFLIIILRLIMPLAGVHL